MKDPRGEFFMPLMSAGLILLLAVYGVPFIKAIWHLMQ